MKEKIIRFLKFMVCNQSAWLVDIGVFALTYQLLGVHYVIGKALSYTSGAIVSYTLNRLITFRTNAKYISDKLYKFVIVNCVSITLSLLSMYVFNDVLGTPVWVGYFLSIFFSFSSNFIGNNFWVFKENRVGLGKNETENPKVES